jgi:hypothetical protein
MKEAEHMNDNVSQFPGSEPTSNTVPIVLICIFLGCGALFIASVYFRWGIFERHRYEEAAQSCDEQGYVRGCVARTIGRGGRLKGKDFSMLYGAGTVRNGTVNIPYLIEQAPPTQDSLADRPLITCLVLDEHKGLVTGNAFRLPPKGAGGLIQAELPRDGASIECKVL